MTMSIGAKRQLVRLSENHASSTMLASRTSEREGPSSFNPVHSTQFIQPSSFNARRKRRDTDALNDRGNEETPLVEIG
jgi:hypothetical protein